MNGVGRKCGEADGHVLRAFRSAVADPFAGLGDYRLSGLHAHDASFVFDDHFAGEHQRHFLEGGTLAGLGPSGGAAHMGDADVRIAGVDATDILVYQLTLRDGNTGGSCDQFGHLFVS